MTEINERIWMPNPAAPRYTIDPVAFVLALVGGPLLVAILGFPVFLIPVFALGYGGLPYLVFGLPILLFHLHRHPCTPAGIARLAFYTMLALALISPLVLAPFLYFEEVQILLWLSAVGLIIAPLWGMAFGWIYQRLARDFYTRAYAL